MHSRSPSRCPPSPRSCFPGPETTRTRASPLRVSRSCPPQLCASAVLEVLYGSASIHGDVRWNAELAEDVAAKIAAACALRRLANRARRAGPKLLANGVWNWRDDAAEVSNTFMRQLHLAPGTVAHRTAAVSWPAARPPVRLRSARRHPLLRGPHPSWTPKAATGSGPRPFLLRAP